MKRLLILCLVISFGISVHAQSDSEDLTGTKVEDFELTDIEGNIISSQSTVGKVVVLNFWFIGCRPCLEEIPELNEVYNEYAGNEDVVFASIALDELKKVRRKLNKYSIQYPVVADGSIASELFQVIGYPTNIVIDREGNYSFRFTGGFPGIGSLLARYIEAALEK
ncbi:MAG: TlpA disulfide reductase family protein [Bacteroidota bacterium]